MAVVRANLAERPAVVVKGPVSRPALVLPGETTTRADLVDNAVREINRLYIGKGIEAARGIGEYVLKVFFGGRSENFRHRGRSHVSFRKLVERPDLRISHAALWKCVAIVDQLKSLPGEVAGALPVSHHVLLLPVRDEKSKLALARKAIRENLTRTALEAEVRRETEPPEGRPRRGRPPDPAVVRLLSALARLAKQSTAQELLDGAVDGLSSERLAELVAGAARDLEQFRILVRRLSARLDGSGSRQPGREST